MRSTGKAALAALCALACSHSIRAQQMADRNPEYRLHRSDVVEVKYRLTPEFDQTASVGPDGRVMLNAAGSFVATGLTLDEFKAQVIHLSAARVIDPEVTVQLKEYEKPHVLVEGEVASPGKVELRSGLSALDAIALAGGFKNSGRKSKVLLLRQEQEGGAGTTRVLDLEKVIADKRLEEAAQLRAGDVIYVTQNKLSKVERLAHMGQFGAIYSPIR